MSEVGVAARTMGDRESFRKFFQEIEIAVRQFVQMRDDPALEIPVVTIPEPRKLWAEASLTI